MIDQFWTPWSNRRTDRWGGSLENRVRFSATLLDAIRRGFGDDFIIGLAVNVDPESDPSLSMESMQEIVAWHDARALMDYVTCGTGSYFDFYKLMPTSLYPARLGEPFAAALKQVTSHASYRRRATSGRPPRPRPSWPPAVPTWSRSCAVRSPTRTSSQGSEGHAAMSGRASRATSCAGGGARGTTGSRV